MRLVLISFSITLRMRDKRSFDKPCDWGEATGRSALMATGAIEASARESESVSASGCNNARFNAPLFSLLDKFMGYLPLLFGVADVYLRNGAVAFSFAAHIALLPALAKGIQVIAPLAKHRAT
jgi:hypothetical protein